MNRRCCLVIGLLLTALPASRAADPVTGCCLVWTLTRDGLTQGTGVVMDAKENLIVTCRHVLRGQPIEVFFPIIKADGKLETTPTRYHDLRKAGKGRRAQILFADPIRDLAILQLDALPAGVSVLPLAGMGSQAGDRVTLMGNPVLRNVMWARCAGTVESGQASAWIWPSRQRFAARTLRISVAKDAEPDVGFSGGPVLNQTGALTGLIVAGRPGAAQTYAVDLHEVKSAAAAAYGCLTYRCLLVGALSRARAAADQAISLNDRSAAAWTAHGDAAWLSGDRAQAIASYRQAARRDPASWPVRARLVALLFVPAN